MLNSRSDTQGGLDAAAVLPRLVALSNEDLRQLLIQCGLSPGPVVATTRHVYEQKLKDLLSPPSMVDQDLLADYKNRSSAAEAPFSHTQDATESGEDDDIDLMEGEESFRSIGTDEESQVLHSTLKPSKYTRRSPSPDYKKVWQPSSFSNCRVSDLSNQRMTSSVGSFRPHLSPRKSSPTNAYTVSASGLRNNQHLWPIYIKTILFIVVGIFVYMLLKRISSVDVDKL
ncbi:unnamed protein product [Soboliphyme baturini]|uniref:LEM domain-containing protein n=1 Tax=Soboliphyme baturini TaxID=241478 RepID=A0A183INJ0_9BILA|nr:unnamed protein product [Soboliphyme baturini]